MAHLSRPQVVHFAILRAVGDDPVRLQGAFVSRGVRLGPCRHAVSGNPFIEPFGTLWFIYLLPVFFVVTKAARRAPPLAIWAAAAALEMTHVATGGQ